jgi:mRNA-degrading endonuclease YafQ of YafQ-DinJ toxin-antitoxin module
VPTYDRTVRFKRDWKRLSEAQRDQFRAAVRLFVECLSTGGRLHPRLRVKRVQGARPGVRELTWAPDGRATFEYGPEMTAGDPHVIWRRIGDHSILDQP